MTECGANAPSLFDPENNKLHLELILALQGFAEYYGRIHRYLSLFICVFGILANILHIVILTRPVMKRSAVNRLLAFMARCDTITMVSYLVYLIRFLLFVDPNNPPYGYPKVWIWFLLGHVVVSIALHAVSLYLSVLTAFIRFTAINSLQSRFMNPKLSKYFFLGTLVMVTILCIPTFLVHKVMPSENPDPNSFEYTVMLPRQENDLSCMLFVANLWLTGVFFKGIPCILLIVFTSLLLYKLNRTRIAHEKIASKQQMQMRCAKSDRTTILLVLLLIVFLVTELPQGFLAILNAIYPNDVHAYIYTSVGELFDLLSLVNGSVCFILYPCISSQYRETFTLLVARLRKKTEDFRLLRPSVINHNYKSVDTDITLIPTDRSPKETIEFDINDI